MSACRHIPLPPQPLLLKNRPRRGGQGAKSQNHRAAVCRTNLRSFTVFRVVEAIFPRAFPAPESRSRRPVGTIFGDVATPAPHSRTPKFGSINAPVRCAEL